MRPLFVESGVREFAHTTSQPDVHATIFESKTFSRCVIVREDTCMKRLLAIIGFPLALTITVSCFSQTPQDTADLPLNINAAQVGRDTNVVIILPTAENTKEACDRIGNYAKVAFKNRGLFLDDTAALKED